MAQVVLFPVWEGDPLACVPVTQDDWSERLTRQIAETMRRRRRALGMSTQKVSDACVAAGHPIHRSVLANLEAGRRPMISVAELLILAKVLDVPPVLLVAPVGQARSVEVLPGVEATPMEAKAWVEGSAALDGGDIPLSIGSLIHDHADHERLAGYMREILDDLTKPEYEDHEGSYADLAELHRGLRLTRDRMRERGEVLPDLPEELAWVDEWSAVETRRVRGDQLPPGFRPGEPLAWERGRPGGRRG
jgi:transcriptional regulator with XRE-family HTH domain